MRVPREVGLRSSGIECCCSHLMLQAPYMKQVWPRCSGRACVRSPDVTGDYPDYAHVPYVPGSLRGQRLTENRRGQSGTVLRPQRGVCTGWETSCLNKARNEARALSRYPLALTVSWGLFPLKLSRFAISCLAFSEASREAHCMLLHILGSLVGHVHGQQSLVLLWSQVSLDTHAVNRDTG